MAYFNCFLFFSYQWLDVVLILNVAALSYVLHPQQSPRFFKKFTFLQLFHLFFFEWSVIILDIFFSFLLCDWNTIAFCFVYVFWFLGHLFIFFNTFLWLCSWTKTFLVSCNKSTFQLFLSFICSAVFKKPPSFCVIARNWGCIALHNIHFQSQFQVCIVHYIFNLKWSVLDHLYSNLYCLAMFQLFIQLNISFHLGLL